MSNKNERTRVIFVKSEEGDKDNKSWEITAVFTDIPWSVGSKDMVTSYTHNGQHGSCSLTWAKEQKLATKEEYDELYKELLKVGYSEWELDVKPYFYEKRLDEIADLLHENHDEINQYLNFDTDDKVWELIERRVRLILEQADIARSNLPF